MSTSKAKCPVCDWVIEGKGIQVKGEQGAVTVCCNDCADKLKKTAKGDKRPAK